MSANVDVLREALQAAFGEVAASIVCARGELTMQLPPEALPAAAERLRDDPAFAFSTLIDLCGVDYAAYGVADWETEDASRHGFSRAVEPGAEREPADFPARFAVVVHLLSIARNQRLRLKVFVDGEPPVVPSLTDVWPAANWFEREAFDLFGIVFEGHPDLRRILTDYGFIGHPLRKDFPLEGHVEVRYDPEQGRVIYQPVTIENRVLVPKVIREDARYAHPEEDAGDG